MISMLQDWQGTIEANGTQYDTVEAFTNAFKPGNGTICIKLYPKAEKRRKTAKNGVTEEDTVQEQELVITVKKYMTQKSNPGFDFMAKWNNDNPMPLRTMVGTRVKETPGMVYMKLHGDILSEKTSNCMCCGRKLTNPVSQYFGIGPECGHHNYVNPFGTEEELRQAVAQYKKQLQEVTWEGWIIKSAITSREERV